MSIDLTVALISLSEAKAFLKVTVATDDAIIGDIVNAASDWINKYCGRVFLQQTYTEFHDGKEAECGELILRQWPVVSVTTLYDDVYRVFGADTLIAAADYVIDNERGMIKLWNNRATFYQGIRNIKVVYVAGYTIGSTAMPYGIQQACRLLTAHIYKNMFTNWRMGIASEQIGDRNITFRDEDVPKLIKSMIDSFRQAIH